MREPRFRLYWLRESGCDAGTAIGPGELPPVIRDRILALTAGEEEEFALRLPFLDRREWRQRNEILSALQYERDGYLIRAVLPPRAATRDAAATLVLTDPVWQEAPGERDPAYFPTWQRVALALQRWLRDHVAEEYFRDPSRLEDRTNTYPMIIYQACRPFYGRPRSEFTYDLRDYPWSKETLAASWKMIGRPTQRVLEVLEQRLEQAGRPVLAHRYAPAWHEDILRAVKQRPRPYADLLAREAAIINAVIDLGTQPGMDSIGRCSRTLQRALRKVHGLDLRHLGAAVLDEAAHALAEQTSGGPGDVVDIGTYQDTDVGASRRPHLGIAG